ncbi:MAG: D-alanyl-D-alanine carboxypeptidase/D-alanyl-D-alanine-endopeptidase [Ignavibacteriae bacterium]|nr:D-alanyl-D-alanine carboxypeptidase/D-alanyl-D-alanine-endopeptidase [Ignavibacteriota bacterium]
MTKTIFIFLLLVSLSLNAQINSKLQKIISDLPASTNVAISILNAKNGEIILEKNSAIPMIPASNTKLFTTATALYLMGKEHIFDTRLLTDDEEISNGIINGNIYIKGFGNSTFTTNDLDTLIIKLKEYGIKTITGNIVGDDSYFDKLYTRDDWIIDERANVKLPPVSALVINKNQYVITLNSKDQYGTKLKYSIRPDANFIDVEMNAKVTKFRAYPKITSSFNNNRLLVKVNGGLRKRNRSSSYVVNIDNPPLYFALLLKEKLENNGIKVFGNPQVGKTPENFEEIASQGIKIGELISLINKNSNNYLAECLFKSLGAYYSGEEGNSFYATQAVLSTFVEDNVIDDQTAVVDGSGISRFNTITTGSISRLLYKVYKDQIYYEDFYKSLSIYGVDGTLKDRSSNLFLTGNFKGKTGTLNGVTAISGYLTTKSNTNYIVSIIMEFKEKGASFHKNIEDKILIELSK